MNKDQARVRAWGLYRDLEKLAARDPDQEVSGIALAVFDACLTTLREYAIDDPIIASMRDAVSPEAIAEGEPLLASQAVVVAGQLARALGPEQEGYPRLVGRLDPFGGRPRR